MNCTTIDKSVNTIDSAPQWTQLVYIKTCISQASQILRVMLWTYFKKYKSISSF